MKTLDKPWVTLPNFAKFINRDYAEITKVVNLGIITNDALRYKVKTGRFREVFIPLALTQLAKNIDYNHPKAKKRIEETGVDIRELAKLYGMDGFISAGSSDDETDIKSYSKAKEKREIYKAKSEQHKYEAMTGKYIEAALVDRQVFENFRALRDRLGDMVEEICGLFGIPKAEARKILNEKIGNVLEGLADNFEESGK